MNKSKTGAALSSAASARLPRDLPGPVASSQLDKVRAIYDDVKSLIDMVTNSPLQSPLDLHRAGFGLELAAFFVGQLVRQISDVSTRRTMLFQISRIDLEIAKLRRAISTIQQTSRVRFARAGRNTAMGESYRAKLVMTSPTACEQSQP